MKNPLRVLAVWLGLLVCLRLLLAFNHRDLDPVGVINTSSQLLLCLLSIQLVRTCSGPQKFVFINLAVFFGFVILPFASPFIGLSLLSSVPRISTYYRLYVSKIGYDFLFIVIPSFILLRYLFPGRKVLAHYVIAFCLAAVILIISYQGLLWAPEGLYSQPDYRSLDGLISAQRGMAQEIHRQPSQIELALRLASIKHVEPAEMLQEVRRWSPYLNEGGSTIIFWRGVNFISMYIECISLALIISFLVAYYRSNRPNYAYIEKFFILMFALVALDLLHTYAYVHAQSKESYAGIFQVGQFVTVGCLVAFVYVFERKLKFVTSPAGQYYEDAIERSPTLVTRWKDEIDNLILRAFTKAGDRLQHIGLKHINNASTKEVPQ